VVAHVVEVAADAQEAMVENLPEQLQVKAAEAPAPPECNQQRVCSAWPVASRLAWHFLECGSQVLHAVDVAHEHVVSHVTVLPDRRFAYVSLQQGGSRKSCQLSQMS